MPNGIIKWIATCALASSAAVAQQQTSLQIPIGGLDPGRNPLSLTLPPATKLTEEFIWTHNDAAALNPVFQAKVRGQDDKTEPHYFRRRFTLSAVPTHATLYIAGPRAAKIFLNGTEVLHFTDDGTRPKNLTVVTADVAHALRQGQNVLAIEEVRGHSSLHTGASPTINQVTYGEVLAVKIVPRPLAVNAPPLVISDRSWRSTLHPTENWSAPGFDDSSWPVVQSLGALGSKSDFLQWNADAGLYAWPGYIGIGSSMRTFRLPVAVMRDATGTLNSSQPDPKHPFTIPASDTDSTITLDFGREVSGRLHLVSASGAPVIVKAEYGESAEEAIGHSYLGARLITVPAHGEAFGPKSAFRYARLTFPKGAAVSLQRIEAEGITYPVRYAGSFTSSDPLLNRIWETGAYTAHLCMQEGIWDAPKRDRGKWMGDLDVTGRVINSVFADRTLMEETMQQVIGDSPVKRDVNTIAGYSALWITGQADFYRHIGDLAYLRTMHQRLLDILAVMDSELDATGFFTNPDKHKVFVDWSTGFNADTTEARAATQFEFYLAYQQAAWLLTELNDQQHATEYSEKAEHLRSAAEQHLHDRTSNTFGSRWQTNAMAVVSGAATPEEQQSIWSHVLSRVPDPQSTDVVTPYYGFYVLSAMAQLNHRAEALTWMRRYWGGMIDEGATSFWEAYDPHWPKQDFHRFLEADNKKGYYVSLAHGWASGPTAWLMQQVLGIEPTAAGFHTVTIRPDLAGLQWAKGTEPTPRGLIRVDLTPDRVRIDLPPDTTATILLPFSSSKGAILQNNRPTASTPSEDGARSTVTLKHAGTYTFTQSSRE